MADAEVKYASAAIIALVQNTPRGDLSWIQYLKHKSHGIAYDTTRVHSCDALSGSINMWKSPKKSSLTDRRYPSSALALGKQRSQTQHDTACR